MHLNARDAPVQFECADGSMRDLNQMPVEFAHEVVRLWRDFIVNLTSHSDADRQAMAPLAQTALDGAIANADNVFRAVVPGFTVEVTPIAW